MVPKQRARAVLVFVSGLVGWERYKLWLRNIPWSEAKNQIKSDWGWRLYHKLAPTWDMLDDFPDLANIAIDRRDQINPGVVWGFRFRA